MIFIFSLLGSLLSWENNLTMQQKLSALISMDGIMIVLLTTIVAIFVVIFLIAIVLVLFKAICSLIKKIFS